MQNIYKVRVITYINLSFLYQSLSDFLSLSPQS